MNTYHSPLFLNGQKTAGKSFSPLNLPAGFFFNFKLGGNNLTYIL